MMIVSAYSKVFIIRAPDKRTPLLAVAEILLVLVDEPRVVFAAYQDDRGVGAEPPDLLVPHGPAVLQRDHAPGVVTHEHYVSAAIGKPPVLINEHFLVTKFGMIVEDHNLF